jgi:hypothetical protein
MSALPPKADIDQSGCDVRFVPQADICSAAKDAYSITAGEREQDQRNLKTQRLGGFHSHK